MGFAPIAAFSIHVFGWVGMIDIIIHKTSYLMSKIVSSKTIKNVLTQVLYPLG